MNCLHVRKSGDGKLMATNYEDYYKIKLEEGLNYQDTIVKKFLTKGIIIIPFSSKHHQYTEGETTGKLVEIKYDGRYSTTRRFWIEVAEKSNPTVMTWTNSGINRDTYWYLIGDYVEAFVFDMKDIRGEIINHTLRENNTNTSVGFLLSKRKAESLCLFKVRFYDKELKISIVKRFDW